MSRATPDDQLKFLLSCVKFSNNGKIEFVEVARECGVVSKGAAAKRYERLLKANGIQPGGGAATEKTSVNPPQRPKKSIKAEAAQKRKRDDSPGFSKTEATDEVKQRPPKQERLDMPFMHEVPQGFRPLPYSHLMHPQQPFMHRQMPPFLHQNMGSNLGPLQQQMMSPPHNPYGMMPGFPSASHFIMPQQPIPPFHLQQNTPTPVPDHNIDLNSFEDFCCPELFRNDDLNPLPQVGNAPEAKAFDLSAPQPSFEEANQTMPIRFQPTDTDIQVKTELNQSVVPAPANPDCDWQNIKTESEKPEYQEISSISSTKPSVPVHLASPETVAPISTSAANDRPPAAIPAEVQSKGKWSEYSQEASNNCIFIAD